MEETKVIPEGYYDFVRDLVREFPWLDGELQQHRKDYGMLVVHLFVSMTSQQVIGMGLGPDGTSDPIVRAYFDYMERHLRDGTTEAIALVNLSFIDDLPEDLVSSPIYPMLGPAILKNWEAGGGLQQLAS